MYRDCTVHLSINVVGIMRQIDKGFRLINLWAKIVAVKIFAVYLHKNVLAVYKRQVFYETDFYLGYIILPKISFTVKIYKMPVFSVVFPVWT